MSEATVSYTERDKAVFKYLNEGKEVFGDPLAIRRKLVIASGASGATIDAILKEAADPPEGTQDTPEQCLKREDAREKRYKVVCAAFGLKEFQPDGTGVTEAEAIAVLSAFVAFL